MLLHDAEIDAITSNKDEATFENTILAYDNAGQMLAQTELVFGMLCEEWADHRPAGGAVHSHSGGVRVRACRAGRSSFYVIAACAATSMMVFQTCPNVFGAVDILPLTGVTFPFVSNGGTAMIASWGLLAFLKATDTRQNASFAIRLPSRREDRRGRRWPPNPPTNGRRTMKKIEKRALLCLLLAAALLLGSGLFVFRFVKNGGRWVSFAANRHLYNRQGQLSVGRVLDRDGDVLSEVVDGQRTYYDNATVRKATLHAVGDLQGNIGTGA